MYINNYIKYKKKILIYFFWNYHHIDLKRMLEKNKNWFSTEKEICAKIHDWLKGNWLKMKWFWY